MLEVYLDIRPPVESQGCGALVRAEAQERRDRHDVALPCAAPGDAFQLAQLFERVDAHVRVRADAEPDPALAELLHRPEAVAEVSFGRGTEAAARSGIFEQVDVPRVGMPRVAVRFVRPEP